MTLQIVQILYAYTFPFASSEMNEKGRRNEMFVGKKTIGPLNLLVQKELAVTR